MTRQQLEGAIEALSMYLCSDLKAQELSELYEAQLSALPPEPDYRALLVEAAEEPGWRFADICRPHPRGAGGHQWPLKPHTAVTAATAGTSTREHTAHASGQTTEGTRRRSAWIAGIATWFGN
ncbi:MAG: hypothetical protein EBR82_22560 [Caulobacteraceae bacterium]|nr:hypothetical protein [Caulobacteraceae bacterium]